ncbi:hypothetical protein LJC55_02955 [Eubacteriales bacterium OttesenSCG-928-N14]|nr:hypothetical protein [Eubacteriales bacterium OttesenSCG-928-N14]
MSSICMEKQNALSAATDKTNCEEQNARNAILQDNNSTAKNNVQARENMHSKRSITHKYSNLADVARNDGLNDRIIQMFELVQPIVDDAYLVGYADALNGAVDDLLNSAMEDEKRKI